ncbi:hypothetical protein DNC46_28000, partial [Escherichia coli]|nr:hypothetical protein [Escherichia coli]
MNLTYAIFYVNYFNCINILNGLHRVNVSSTPYSLAYNTCCNLHLSAMKKHHLSLYEILDLPSANLSFQSTFKHCIYLPTRSYFRKLNMNDNIPTARNHKQSTCITEKNMPIFL